MIAALVLSDNSTEIVVALLGVVGVMGAGWFASDRRTKRVDRKVDVLVESIGEKNGHGTVQDQGPAILAELAEIRGEIQASRATQHAMQTSIDSIVDAASHVSGRLKQHDREIADLKRSGRAPAVDWNGPYSPDDAREDR